MPEVATSMFDQASLDDAISRRNRKRKKRVRAAWRNSLNDVATARSIYVQALAAGKTEQQAMALFNAYVNEQNADLSIRRPSAHVSVIRQTVSPVVAAALARKAEASVTHPVAEAALAAAVEQVAPVAAKPVRERKPREPRKPRVVAEPVAVVEVPVQPPAPVDTITLTGTATIEAEPHTVALPALGDTAVASTFTAPQPKRRIDDDEITDPDVL